MSRIIQVETRVEKIPLAKPFVTALRRVEVVEFVRVYVTVTNSLQGIGEAPATKAITGEDIESILDSINFLRKELIGKSTQEAQRLLHQSKIGSSAKAALDIALFALDCKESAQSFAECLQVKDFTPLQSDVTISLGEIPQMLLDAKDALKRGMPILKVKVGSDIAHAIEITKRLCKECREATLLIDANQAWGLDESLAYVRAVNGQNIALIEQPVAADDLVSLKKTTEHSSIPILADEAVFTLEDAKKIVESQSADMINIKLMKCGGITKAIEILEYAREQGVVCMLGSMLEGPYSINAALYLAFAYRDVIGFIDLDSPMLYREKPHSLDFSFKGATISYVGSLESEAR